MATSALGERLERQVRERAGRAGHTAGVKMEVELRRNWQPHASQNSETMRSISVRLETVTANSLTYVARADTPQARFVNDGTSPHIIRARNVRFLRFEWPEGPDHLRSKDGFFYFPEVRHPGYRGSGWWDYTIAQWPDMLAAALG